MLLSRAAVADPEKMLLNDVYSGGGTTLYCQTEFEQGARLSVDYIYAAKDILRHYGCITSGQCSSNADYVRASNDMHNLYPVERKMEVERRNSLYGELSDSIKVGTCGAQISFQMFDPPAHAKGNIARAMLYMSETHGMPLVGELTMYQRWHQEDPVDDAERARNGAIFRLQTKRNPFIDDPERALRMGRR